MHQPEIPTTLSELYSRFSPEEMAFIVQMKRFLECVEGDAAFRKSVDTGHFTPEQLAHLRDIGITFSVNDVALMWKEPETAQALFTTNPIMESVEDVPGNTLEASKHYPLLYVWTRFVFLKNMMNRHNTQRIVVMPSQDPRFAKWRQRRIAATKSELGPYGLSIDHPTLAIELAVGCSVGCYFCAYDAPKLQTVFDYTVPVNRALFRGVAQSLTDVMGPALAGRALLYYSTEPNDNSHYIDFMKAYHEITGRVVCTSTARYDEAWIRNLVAYYREGSYPWPRISVLSRKVMQRLHQQFTPDEFRDVTLVMQQRDNEPLREKVPGGRPKMLERLHNLADSHAPEDVPPVDGSLPQGSIACVSGFLINMIEKTVKLVSPCYTTMQYPYGYRVFDEAQFETVSDFDRIIRAMVDRKMMAKPYPSMPMRFRDDLRYRPQDNGFELTSRYFVHPFKGEQVWGPLGELMARGNLTYGEVCDMLLDTYQCNPMIVAVMIQNLFDRGFLDERDTSYPTPTDTTPVESTTPTPVGA